MQRRISNPNIFQNLSAQIQRLPSGIQAGLLVVAYVLTGLVLNRFAAAFESSWHVTPWHPASGLHFALLLGFGLRYTPAILIVPLLGGLVFASDEVHVLTICLVALWTMLCYGGASALLLRKLHFDPRLRRFRDVVWFSLFGAFFVPLAESLVNVTSFVIDGIIPWSQWQERVMSEWAGAATGIAMVTPLLLVLLRDHPLATSTLTAEMPPPTIKVGWPPNRRIMGLSLEVLALAIAIWVAYGTAPAKSLDYTYFIFIPLTWIAVWHGFARVTLAILLLNIGVVLFVHSDLGVNRPLALQFCLMAVSYTSLLLGAVVSDRLRVKEKLRYNSLHDSLTGLANRSLFLTQLAAAVDLAKPPNNCLSAVLFIDFDRFKAVNDSLGHFLGDQLLIQFSHRLEAHLRPRDTAARLGGDEFGVLLENIQGTHDAGQLAEQIHQDLLNPFDLEGHQIFMSTGIGIALTTDTPERPDELFRRADIALLQDKRRPSSRYAVFDTTMQQQTVKLLQLENELRQGLARQEFEVYYQPIVCLKTGQLSGFEALIRWQHPTRGMIAPGQFLLAAEETGLIVPMGQWVLGVACRQIKTWQLTFSHSPSLTMAVNLADKQFLQPDIVAQVDQVLQETGLEGRYLNLEITEGIVTENPEEAAFVLRQVQALGVQLSIDDFGTGYSSLSRLHHFPVSTLKIDRSFITQMGAGGKNAKLIQSIVALAHSLEMQVVAEGIETAGQFDQLKALQCDQGQGYFLARPLSSQRAEALLATAPQW